MKCTIGFCVFGFLIADGCYKINIIIKQIFYVSYPHFGRIEQVTPNPSILLGNDIFWTEKLDGSNAGIYLKMVNRWLEEISTILET